MEVHRHCRGQALDGVHIARSKLKAACPKSARSFTQQDSYMFQIESFANCKSDSRVSYVCYGVKLVVAPHHIQCEGPDYQSKNTDCPCKH